ncbi:hypothetical protein AAVH_25204 [Aphelenchoides avenae]|nr:hypothetical protein AAVH_25204 [Aphelenchus avenae]
MPLVENIDILCAAIDFLSRLDIEVLEITAIPLRDIVRKHYAHGPFRHFLRLDMRGATSTLISEGEFDEDKGKFNETKLWHYQSADDLCNRLRNSVIDFVDFSNVVLFDEELLNAMMTVKSAWSRGTCRTADVFVSGEVLEKAYDELFACQEMLMSIQPIDDRGSQFTLSRSILSLDAVMHCVRLEIWHAPYPYSAQDLVNWLNHPSPFGDNKTLRIMPSGFGYTGKLDELVEAIKEDFRQSENACRYEMQIILKKSDVTRPIFETLSNKFTSEELHVNIHPPHRFHQATKLLVQRKPKRPQKPKSAEDSHQSGQTRTPAEVAQRLSNMLAN